MAPDLYQKNVVCLYCEQRFSTSKVKMSKVVVDKKDSDFCTYYRGSNPYYYEVNVCPRCGYAFTDSFSQIKENKKAILERVYINRSSGIDLCGERSLEDAMRSYKMALVCAALAGETNLIQAGLCMRIAWLYRYRDKGEEEREYLLKALSLYEKAFATDDVEETLGKDRLLYLLGELHGRLGNYEETRKWFNKLLSQKNIDPAIGNIAREQWSGYRMALAGAKG